MKPMFCLGSRLAPVVGEAGAEAGWVRLVLTGGLCTAIGLMVSAALFATDAVASDETLGLEPDRYEHYELSNGLDVILYEDHRIPVAAVNVWYHVGSKNEREGRTGFAHLFEHMMFQGSKHHDTDYFVPLEKVGAFVNGSTSEDRTNYLEDVPCNYLQTALWLEADRMGFLLPAMTQERLDNQRDVVMNERRQRVDNQPYGKADELILGMMYPPDHPYSHSVIGTMEDLSVATLEDVKSFFREYYAPNNASLCITGDFDRAQVKQWVDQYFGPIPPGKPIDRMEVWVPELTAVRRARAEDAVALPRLYMAWHTPEFYTQEDAACDLLASILGSGKTSRLYQALVYEQEIAQDVTVYQDSREIGSLFRIEITAKPGYPLEEVEAAADVVLRELLENGIERSELERAQAGWEAGFIRRLQRIGSFGGLADRLNSYNVYLGEPDRIAYDRARYTEATADFVEETARAYLDLDRRAILHLVSQGDPEAGEERVDRSIMPAPQPKPSFSPPVIQSERLESGLDLYVVEDHRLPLVQANLILRAGWADDPTDRPGVAAVTADLLDEGTRSKSALEISEVEQRLGAQLATFANFDGSGLQLNVLKKNLADGFELMAEVLLEPSFPEDEFDRLRERYLAQIEQHDRQPMVAAIKAFQKLVYGEGHPYSQPYTGTGTRQSLDQLTREDIVRYYQTYYRPNQAAFLLVGDITLDEARSLIERHMKDWDPGAAAVAPIPDPPPIDQSTIYVIDRPDAPQSVVVAGTPALERSSPEYLAAQVMNTGLGGTFIARLNMNLREDKGYTYHCGSQLMAFRGQGVLVAFTQVDAKNTANTVAELVKEFSDVVGARPLADEEIADSKATMIKGFPQAFETLGGIAGQLGQIVTYDLPLDEWQTYVDRVRQIDGSAATRAAQKLIHPDRMMIVVVGDAATVEDKLRQLGWGDVRVLDPEDLHTQL